MGALGSRTTSTSKSLPIRPSAEPNEARITDARRGFLDRRSWTGRSFCAWGKEKLARLIDVKRGTGGVLNSRHSHNLDSCLSIVPNIQRKWRFEPRLLLFQDDECLMRSLRLAIVLRAEANLDRLGALYRDWLWKRVLSV